MALVNAWRTVNELLSLANAATGVGASASLWCEETPLVFELMKVVMHSLKPLITTL